MIYKTSLIKVREGRKQKKKENRQERKKGKRKKRDEKKSEKLLTSVDQVPHLINLLLDWKVATVTEVLKELTSFQSLPVFSLGKHCFID